MTKKVKKKKQKRRVRTRDWSASKVHDTAFSVDRPKHLRTGSQAREDDTVPMLAEGDIPNAQVISATGSWAFLLMDDKEVLGRIPDAMMVGRASVLAPGDRVRAALDQDTLFVNALAPRQTKLSRYMRRARVNEQVIAANVDVLLIVAAARKPRFKPGLVDRYLVAAQVGGVEPVLVINKMDLVDEPPPAAQLYDEIGIPVYYTSCARHEGIDELHAALRGKLSVLAGHSGVGKSSLLNAMDPALRIAVQEVSDYNEKGRHTTSVSRLYMLSEDVRVIDTPGVRNLGLWGVSHEELSFYFPEMEELAAGCQFRDCSHMHEPECAVLRAVEEETIPRKRYQSYVRIRQSLTQQQPEY
jgi:ribosome biogenesis GTPase